MMEHFLKTLKAVGIVLVAILACTSTFTLTGCGGGGGNSNPPTEICGDGIDNDGDGQIDEGCPPPYTGPFASQLATVASILSNQDVQDFLIAEGFGPISTGYGQNIEGDWSGGGLTLDIPARINGRGNQYPDRIKSFVLDGLDRGQVHAVGNNGNDVTCMWVTEGGVDILTEVHIFQASISGGNLNWLFGSVIVGVHAPGANLGQIGTGSSDLGTATRVSAPAVEVVGLGSGDDSHTSAVLDDGRVLTWGQNYVALTNTHRLGYVSTLEITPREVPGLSGQTMTDCGQLVTIASDGTNIWELTSSPTQLTTPAGASIVSIESYLGRNMALRSDGTLLFWDDGGTPTAVPGISGVVEVKMSNNRFLVRKTGGVVELREYYTWSLMVNAGSVNAVSIAAGSANYFYVTGTGQVWSMFGDSSFSQVAGVSGATKVWSAFDHAIVRASGEQFLGWGSNALGQLGQGHTSTISAPTALFMSAVDELSTGVSNTHWTDSYGNLWGAGLNSNGQLGDGTQTNRNVFVEVDLSAIDAP